MPEADNLRMSVRVDCGVCLRPGALIVWLTSFLLYARSHLFAGKAISDMSDTFKRLPRRLAAAGNPFLCFLSRIPHDAS